MVISLPTFVICFSFSDGHKKSHGPLLPGAKSKVHHGRAKARGHGPKHHHFHGPKHHHSHGPKHHHFKKTMHVVGHHFKHKHNLKLKHKHQPMLHLKAHKKGVTFAKSPAEPREWKALLVVFSLDYWGSTVIENLFTLLCLPKIRVTQYN